MLKPATHVDLESLAASLEASDDYRVLRRLQPGRGFPKYDGSPLRQGLVVDVETTGLDPVRDEIIELAMVPFSYTLNGDVISLGEPFHAYRQPSKPITPEITALTGITDEMVAGKSIDPAEVASFIATARLVVAHNAGFDRKFLERFCESFSTKPWACSMGEVPWKNEGFEGVKLAYIAQSCGFFYDRHRAIHDCQATVEILARRLPTSGVTALSLLLQSARTPVWRVWAENSPFEMKDVLKARGYRWNGDPNGRPKSWWRDVADAQKDEELAYLRREIYGYEADLPCVHLSAYDRYSDRA